MNINQPEVLFWGGPLHGENKKLLGGSFYVPVLVPLEQAVIVGSPVPAFSTGYRTERYNIHQFTWKWKTGWYSGFAMILSPASFLIWELENILNVLGGLWGGGNSEYENIYS